jgi:asparagine synthase (glutamine-hydrolysing)
MCGIVGRVEHPEASHPGRTDYDGVVQTIRHRGPDMEGEYRVGPVWFGHCRLSILDVSSRASQPMATEDGRFVLCYNGEVYNFAELADSLGLHGLRSTSDTEVVLRAFASRGLASLRMLNGMFAFAMHDTAAQKVWLVRDRLGIKPLYYQVDEAGLSFGSEIAALLALDDRPAACEVPALHEWLYYGTTLGARTLVQGVQRLLPGHYLELNLRDFSMEIRSYWSASEYASKPKFPGNERVRIERTRDLLSTAVARQLVSDVPVGVCLSGGVDSAAITAFASRHYDGRLATYSVGFDYESGKGELPEARALATHFGTDHHEIHVAGVDIADVVERMVDHHGTPFSDAANIPLYLVGKHLAGRTKVVLQGDGGDELFGGYNRYRVLHRYRAARVLARAARYAIRLTPRSVSYHRRARFFNALAPRDPAEVMALLLTEEDGRADPTAVFQPEFRRMVRLSDPFARYREVQRPFAAEDLVNQMLFIDAQVILPDTFLEKVDRSTMASSIEVRVPFLDHDLVDFCFRLSGKQKLPGGKRKWLLKKALEGIVPADVLTRKKKGFGVPYGQWLRGPLRPLFHDHLVTFTRREPEILDERVIASLFAEHVERRRDRSFLLWKMLNFMVWSNRFHSVGSFGSGARAGALSGAAVQ